MKKALLVLCLMALVMAGCAKQGDVALKVGPVDISPVEFEQAFQESRYVNMGDKGKSIFLDQYIDTKLILMEAERIGLDKDPEFLNDIQHFWEQVLLKRIIAEKNKEFLDKVNVSLAEILAYYQQHQASDFQGKSLEEAQEKIKWILIKIKQSQALGAWTEDLRSKSDIKINKALLGMKE